jgi:hypothetical protein
MRPQRAASLKTIYNMAISNRPISNRVFSCLLCFALSSCVTFSPQKETSKPPCYKIKTWSKEEQLQILHDEQSLPESSILIAVLEDYKKTRLELKASCDNTD